LDGLRAASSLTQRPAELGELEITVTPRGRMTPEKAAAFAELGVDRLVVLPLPTPDEAIETATKAVDRL